MADDKRLEHAWNYFELHAQQRISVFNYFVVLSGILAAGLAASVQGPERLASVGVALGALLILLSFVFWKLDQRTAFLIKHAEEVLKACEPTTAPLFSDEETKTDTAKAQTSIWTYGRSFRTIFLVIGAAGLAGAILSGLRFAGVVQWEESSARVVAQGKSVLSCYRVE